jgi:hypothetical protein
MGAAGAASETRVGRTHVTPATSDELSR